MICRLHPTHALPAACIGLARNTWFLKALRWYVIERHFQATCWPITAAAAMVYSPAVAGLGEDWHYGFGLWHECQSATYNCAAGSRISSPGAYGAYPFWDRSKGYFGIVARQGTLGTFPNGVAIERAVRPKAEEWAACP